MDVFIIYGIAIVSLIITLGAQAFITSSYSKYSKVRNSNNLTGAEAARRVLDKNGLTDVKVQMVSGKLTDHYDPRNKTVNLSTKNYSEPSVASVAVACHECGHAIQDKNGYIFLKIRSTIVPLVNFASKIGYIVIMISIITSIFKLLWIGILTELIILLFQIITLPVEFDASNRALKQIEKLGIINKKKKKECRGMLTAAALTYVAGVATALIEIFRLILIARSDERR